MVYTRFMNFIYIEQTVTLAINGVFFDIRQIVTYNSSHIANIIVALKNQLIIKNIIFILIDN
jgi:hypothetical protein